MKKRNAAAIAVAAALGALAGPAGWAFACTAQAHLVAASPASAPEGSTVAVRGQTPAQGPVEIRWNTITGPAVATAVADEQGNFSASLTVPAVAPGVYALVATSKGAGVGRTAFEVTPSGASAVSPLDVWGGSAPTYVRGASRSAGGTGMLVGSTMLAVGTVGLFGGFTVLALRRRRLPVG